MRDPIGSLRTERKRGRRVEPDGGRRKEHDAARRHRIARPAALLIAAAALLLLAPAVFAAPSAPDTHTWVDGAADDNWSTAANWSGGSLPSSFDSLIFPNAWATATNDEYLAVIGSAQLLGGMTINGSSLAMFGPLDTTGCPTWNITKTTAAADLTITNVPSSSVTPSPMDMGSDIELGSTSYGDRALTFDVGSLDGTPGGIICRGSITGASSACSLTKKGPGYVTLGYAGWSPTWDGENVYGGPTDVQAGTLIIRAPGALPDGSALDIHGEATVRADFYTEGDMDDTWPNIITGAGDLIAGWGELTLTGASPDFTGRFGVEQDATGTITGSLGADALIAGTLRGNGSADGLTTGGYGTVSPGVYDGQIDTLTFSGGADFTSGGAIAVDLQDATGAAGTDWDYLDIAGGITLPGVDDNPLTISVRSVTGGDTGPCANFDPGRFYRWHVACAPAGITGSADDNCWADDSGFWNDTAGGHFYVDTSEVDGVAMLDLCFEPGGPLVNDPVVGDGGSSFQKGSKQTVSWNIMEAAIGAEFRVYAIDPATGSGTLLGTVPVTTATLYSFDWTITQGPSEGWQVQVRYVDGEYARWRYSQTFAITTPPGAPTTTVSGLCNGWRKKPATLTFTGVPGESGAAITAVEYSINGGAWVEGASVRITAQGATKIRYRSRDANGAVQDPAGRCAVRVDTRRPRVDARPVTGAARGQVKMAFRAVDPMPGSGRARVHLVVLDGRGRELTRATTLWVPVNQWRTIRISTRALAPGTYTIKAVAKDFAGNTQRRATSVKLTVR